MCNRPGAQGFSVYECITHSAVWVLPVLPSQGLLPGVDTDALSWQELKLAAEAGFEELLRAQEAAAAAAGQQAAWGSSSAWRRPGMTRATGGGGTTAEAWPGPAQLGRAAQGVCGCMHGFRQLAMLGPAGSMGL